MHVSKINILLTALGITHQQIAEATRLSQSMVTMTINGERTSRKTQDRIIGYIREQVTIESLFGIEPAPTPPASPRGPRSKRKRADLIY